MKFKLTIFILLVAALLSCSNSNYTWVKLYGEGLRESQNTTHCLLVINSKVAFLGGGYTSDENFKNRTFLTGQEATLFKTKDSGRSWSLKTFGTGNVEEIIQHNNEIFLLVRKFSENSYNNLYSEIYLSKDIGVSWQKILSTSPPDNIESLISGKDQIIIAVESFGKEGKKSVYKKSISPYENWETLGEYTAKYVTSRPIFSSERVYFIAKQEELISISLASKKMSSENLPSNFLGQKLATDDLSNIWIIGEKNQLPIFLKKQDNGDYSEINFNQAGKSPLISGVHITNNNIMVIAVTSSSLLGATHKLFISSDKGTTWSDEKFPFPLIVKPFFFLGKGELWAHGGGRLIQKRLLRF